MCIRSSIEKYDSKLAAIKNAIQLNIEVISNKKDTPEQIFELQDDCYAPNRAE